MRRFTLATAATAALLLSACGGATDPADPTPAPTTEVAPTPTPTLEPAPTTEPAAPTEEPTVEPTVEPTEEPTPEPTAEATPEPIEDPTAPATDPGTESHEIRPGEEPVGSEDFPTAGGDLFLADVEVSADEVGRSAVFTFEGADTLDWEAEFVDEALQQGSGEPVDMGNAEQILKVTVSGLRYPEPGEDVISDVDASGAEDMTIVVDPPFEGMSVLFIGVTHTEFASIEVIEEEAQTLLSVTF